MAIEAASRNEVYLIVFYERASIYRVDISQKIITLFKRLDVGYLDITYISSHMVWIDKQCRLWSWAFTEDDAQYHCRLFRDTSPNSLLEWTKDGLLSVEPPGYQPGVTRREFEIKSLKKVLAYVV